MLNTLFFFCYGIVFLIVLWQAFRFMRRGLTGKTLLDKPNMLGNNKNATQDRTGKLTIHPEILDQEGRITDEELLTVRFSGDNDHPPSTSSEETSAE